MIFSIYRPYSKGSIHALIHVRSTGHYVVSKDWSDNRRKKDFLQLFWCVSGCGEFRQGNSAWTLHPGEVCFYFPGDTHDITSSSPEWDYYWLTIDGPCLSHLMETFRLAREPCKAGNCPAELFVHLAQELHGCTPRGEFRAGAVAYEILSLASAGNEEEENSLVESFKSAVGECFGDSAVNVDFLSRKLKVHRSTLTRLVTRSCGMSPSEYLISCRIQEALHLLYDSSLTMKEVAEQTGFHDQNYFAKVILRRLGKTPTQLRHRK